MQRTRFMAFAMIVAALIALWIGDVRAADDSAKKDDAAAKRFAGGDEHKAYFLIGADREKPKSEGGYRLLLVLPGGDGSADFHPFVRNIHANALGDDWLIAQLIAPVWDEQAQRIVWPTRGLPWGGMKFPTERFIDAVIEDVVSQHEIDARHIYALGWSSGGPPVYAASMQEKTKLRGAFIAMSVFHPQQYPDPANAKGRAFYLLHSPDDFIQMRFPEAARDALREAGAKVHLETYEGGHGWRGDVFGMIRTGVEWLVEQ